MPSHRVHGNNMRKEEQCSCTTSRRDGFQARDGEGLLEEGVGAKALKMARLHGWRENRTGFLERERGTSYHTELISALHHKDCPSPRAPAHSQPQSPAGSISVRCEASSPISTMAPDRMAGSHLYDAETCSWAFSSPSSTRRPRAATAFAFWTALSVRSYHALFSERT